MNTLDHEAIQAAKNFTQKGIQGLINHAQRTLIELDSLDACHVGREAREKGRVLHQHNLEIARRAMEIRREAGLS